MGSNASRRHSPQGGLIDVRPCLVITVLFSATRIEFGSTRFRARQIGGARPPNRRARRDPPTLVRRAAAADIWTKDRRPRPSLFDRSHCLPSHLGESGYLLFEDDRLGGEFSMLKRVPIALRSPASRSVHPAHASSPHRRRPALESAPLRSCMASRRLAHMQEHGVVLRFFRAPRPPRVRR